MGPATKTLMGQELGRHSFFGKPPQPREEETNFAVSSRGAPRN
jgi:hypothetical protein